MYSQSNTTTWTYSYSVNGSSYTQTSSYNGFYNDFYKQFMPKKKNIQYKHLLTKE